MIGLQRFLSWSVALSVRNVCLTAEILCLVLIALSLSSVERLGGGITQHWRLLSGRLKRSSLCLPITNHIFLTLKPHLSYVYTFPLIFQLSLITRCCILTWSVTLSCSYTLLILCQILNWGLFCFVPSIMTVYLNHLST